MKRGLLIAITAFLLAGCGRPALHRRFEAERARYWAERTALRYSLEADPQVRRRFYRTALAYLRVAQEADTTGLSTRGDATVLAELVSLQSWGWVRAGDAFLRAGRFELANEQLELAESAGPAETRAQAALLRAEAFRAREMWEETLLGYQAFEAILKASPPPGGIGNEVLEIPISFVTDLKHAAQDSVLERASLQGHRFYTWVQKEWEGQACALRAAFLDHRLEIAAGRWTRALKSLNAYQRRELSERDWWNSEFDRAEILAQGLKQLAGADSLYALVSASAPDEELRGLAALRQCEVIVLQGRREEAVAALAKVEKKYSKHPDLVAAALYRQAQLLQEAENWSRAQPLYRRILQRYPSTGPGLRAPLQLIDLQRSRHDERAVKGALLQAEDQYQRLIAGHASSSKVAVSARKNLIECFLQQDKIQEALYELEQLHHVLGGSLAGGEALLEAARVARDRLHDPQLAGRYLRWVEREMPANRVGLRAREMLEELETDSKDNS